MSTSLSTHVLDTARGEPAAGVRVQVHRDDRLLAEKETDSDGRIQSLLDEPLETGTYRLAFFPASSPFFKRLEVDIEIDDAGSNYHVPLLVSPFGCTTYRGS